MTTHDEAETIRFTADVVAVTPDRRVLLIQREWDPYEGHWALPGGHVDIGETSLAAAVRELFEETGVTVAADAMRLIGVWDAPGRDPRGRYVTVAYLATVPTGTTATAGDDARRAAWWPLDALPEQIAFDHAEILRTLTDHRPRTTHPKETDMAKAKKNNDDATVVNIATPGSVVGIQCGGSIVGSTVTVNGNSDRWGPYPSGRWIDPEDIDRSRNSNPDD